MPHMQRHLQAGAAFAYRLSDLADIRARFTVVGNPTIVDSAYGRALHVSPGNNITATYQVGKFPHGTTGDFSVVFRIRTTDNSHAVLGNKRIDGDTKGFSVRIGSGEIILKVGDGAAYTEITSVTEIDDGEWHHVAFTVDRNGNSYVYVDGNQEGVVANLEDGDDITSTLDLAIGCDALGGFDMTGDLESVIVFNRNLSEAEVAQLAGVA